MAQTLFFADLPQSTYLALNSGILNLSEPLLLDSGQILHKPRLAWRRLGEPHLPAIFILGGISAGRYAWCTEQSPTPGWWQDQIGPGNALDPQKYQLLSFDFLGSSGNSEGPHNSRLSGPDFPAITTRDQARAIAALLKALGIQKLESMIGASYGGMVTLAFAQHFSEYLKKALVICAADRPAPLATAWRHVQREIVSMALKQGDPEAGLRLARELAVTTYRSELEFSQRFDSGLGSAGCLPYLKHQGQSFAKRFDPYSYLCLSTSIDTHRIEAEAIPLRVDLLGYTSDLLVPAPQLKALHTRLPKPGNLTLLNSPYGHDAFLKENLQTTQTIKNHLERKHD